jgi:hypothetical protein
MARVLYFDCFSGISGDMVLGAFLDAGLPFDDLKRALGSLAMPGYDIRAERVLRAGVSATTSFESFQSPDRKAFNGLCLVLVRGKAGQSGTIKLTAKADGLEMGAVSIRTLGEGN